MGYLFGGATGQSQADVTDARKRLAAAMLQQGADTSPVQSGWEGAARMAQALMGGLAMRNQANQQKAADAQVIAAITGQPYTPPEQPKGFFGGLFGPKEATPGATGSSMPKTDTSGNVALTSTVTPGGLPEVSDYIRQAAISRGVDPNIALRVAGHEGLNVFDPSKPDNGGDEGSSFGPFQLHYAGMSKSMPNSGLGNEFTNATGLHARDPSTWKQQVDFALDWARKHGWGPWMGAKAEGITGKMGIGDLPPQQAAQAAAMPPTAPLQPPPVNPPAPSPTPGYVDPRVVAADRPAAPPMPPASAPSEVASLDPSIGIPMPGAAGQMRASDPAQVMPPQAGPQAALPPLPVTNVGPTPNVASMGPVDRSGVGMGGDVPGAGAFPPAPTGGGQPASPQQTAQAQSGPARLANALDNASPAPAANPMANPRVQALVQAMTNPNASPQVRALAAQSLQTIMKPPEYGFQVLPDGTVLRSDPRTGTLTPVYRSEMSQADQAKLDFDREKFRQEQANRGTMTAADQARIDFDRQKLAQDQANRNTMTAAEQANADLERNKLDLEKNKPVIVQPGETLVNPQTKEQIFQGAGYKPEDVTNLRKEIQGLPTYKSYQQALPSYSSMIDTAKTDSKASDLNLIYGLGKIMDPNSVVREGEMTMVQNTSSWPDWLKGAYDSVTGGSRLEPETRKAILGEAHSRMMAYRGALDNDISQYRGIIGRRGMNEADILPILGDIAGVPDLVQTAPLARTTPPPAQAPAQATAPQPQGTPRPRATNPQTGEVIEFDGTQWVPVK
ncbi:hypothetical protein AMC87_CH04024 [Rhizobium phaseoli]|uniref:hypothetical protein n=1 Tax=Rhizobium phaseoli TaxID=396 RepID=UPI0007E9E017|nr:hypothetical protein [Rhizobium phaseoli]ANL48645.1 hypothetical protein AMC87_CH04024 [Rhizobium phaseoli]